MKNIIVILILFFAAGNIISQETELKLDDVQVIKEFNAEIGNFNKVNIDPVLPVYDVKSRKYEYKIMSIPAKMEYDKPKIRPLALKPENPREINRFHALLAYGTHQLLKIDAGAFFNRSNWAGGVGIHHISANNEKNLKDQNIAASGISLTATGVNKVKKHIYELKAKVDNSYIYLYSKSLENPVETANNKRRYLCAEFSGLIKAEELFFGLSNDAEIKIHTFQFNAQDLSENELFINNKSAYILSENSRLVLPLAFQYILSENDFLFNVKPYYNYSSRPLNLKAGISLGFAHDKKIIDPYVEVSSNLWHNFIELFASYGSELKINTNFTNSSINPFYSFSDSESKSSKFTNITAGLRNSLEGARLEFKVSYQKFKDHLFFKLDSKDFRTFNSVFDDGTNIKIEGKASYKPLKKFEIGGSVVKNIYKLDNFDKPWYTPDLSANVFSNASLFSDKVIIGGELFIGTAPWFEDESGNNKKLDPLLDLNGSIKYMITKKGSCFININNLFSQNYQRWYNYPDYGLSLMAGIELRF